MHSKFLEKGSVLDKPRNGRPATTITDENTDLLVPALTRESPSRGLELELRHQQIYVSADASERDKALAVPTSGLVKRFKRKIMIS